MERFSLETAKIVGASTPEFWSQIHIFSPQDQEKLTRRGQLVAAIALKKTSSEGEIVAFGREIISRLQEEYFGNLEEEALPRLKKAVTQVIGEIVNGFEVEIVAAVLQGKLAYLVVFGPGQVVIRRDDSLAVVCQGREKEIAFSSGYLQKSDLLFLATADFFQNLTEGVLRAALATDSPQEAVERLTPMVYSQPDFKSAAAVVVKLRSRQEGEGVGKEASEEEKSEKKTVVRRRGRSFLQKRSLFFLTVFLKKGLGLLQRKLKKKPSLGKISPRGPRERPRTALWLALATALFLLVSLGLGWRQKSLSLRQREREEVLARVQTKLGEGQALIELNPIRARQLLEEAKKLLADLEDQEPDGTVVTLNQEIEEGLRQVLREYQLGELSLFFDLGIIKEGGRGQNLALAREKLIVLDQAQKAVYEIELKTKKGRILTGGDEFEGAYDLTASEEKVFILTPKGIIEKNLTSGHQSQVVEADPTWGRLIDFSVYSGNLYLLDQKNLDLYRYPVIEGGFGARQSWLKEEGAGLAEAVSMAINGSIWLLRNDGQILKLTRGLADSFGVAGLGQSFSSPRQIYTEADWENLYVLDQEGRRVVVLGKDGEYRAQYAWSEGEKIAKIVVSEAKRKLWLLVESKIYEVELR